MNAFKIASLILSIAGLVLAKLEENEKSKKENNADSEK